MENINQEYVCIFFLRKEFRCVLSFPGGSDGKTSACNAEDLGSTTES